MRAGDDSANLVDMVLDIQSCTCAKCFPGPRQEPVVPELFLSAGGRWNRRLNDWEGDADTCSDSVVARIHPGQVEATRWYAKWLAVHAGRRDSPPVDYDMDDGVIDTDPTKVYSAMLAGGRRAGKTFWAAIAVVAYAVQFPNSIIWVVSPSRGRDDTKPDEIRRYIVPLLAPSWIRRQTVATGWELINGSNIMLKSGHAGADPDAIKEGQADLVWLNEAQKMAQRVYVVARGAISDKGGLVLCCANPPVEAKDQQWVSDFVAQTEAGKRASVYVPFNPMRNPHIVRGSLRALAHEVDERTYQIEALGMFMPAADAVAYNWSRADNEKKAPTPQMLSTGQRPCPRTGLIDVTADYLRSIDLYDGITNLIGMDFQVHPWMGGPVYRIFCRPDEPIDQDHIILWGVDELVISGDELEWSFYAKSKGYDPTWTLIIGDGTGEYQHSRRRSTDSPPPEWKGRGSFSVLRGEGWTNIVRPDPKIPRNNPHVVDRVRAMTSLIQTADKKRRRLYMDPDRCPKTCKSIREWPTVHGKPSRTSEAAHLGDGASYPIVRLFPRLMRSGNTAPGGEQTEQRSEQPLADAGDAFFGSSPPGGRRGRRNYGL